jgi:hypothetical protein
MSDCNPGLAEPPSVIPVVAEWLVSKEVAIFGFWVLETARLAPMGDNEPSVTTDLSLITHRQHEESYDEAVPQRHLTQSRLGRKQQPEERSTTCGGFPECAVSEATVTIPTESCPAILMILREKFDGPKHCYAARMMGSLCRACAFGKFPRFLS